MARGVGMSMRRGVRMANGIDKALEVCCSAIGADWAIALTFSFSIVDVASAVLIPKLSSQL
jgi:hypothetical protein